MTTEKVSYQIVSNKQLTKKHLITTYLTFKMTRHAIINGKGMLEKELWG